VFFRAVHGSWRSSAISCGLRADTETPANFPEARFLGVAIPLAGIEEEFIFMKADLNRVKAVLREKLGVVLD